jgi:hypothetical protein
LARVSFAFALLAPVAAHAQGEAYRLEYEAPPSCPTRAAFERQVVARVEGAQHAAAGDIARRFSVRITRSATEPAFRGEVRFLDRHQDLVARELAAHACKEVADALALVTALAINAQDEPVRTEMDPVLAPEVLAPPRTRIVATPAALPRGALGFDGNLEAWDRAVRLESERDEARSKPSGGTGAWALRPSGLATLDTGSGTPAAYGLELGLGLARTRLSRRWVLRLRYATPGVVERRGERARFDLVAAGAAACLAPWTWHALGVTACPTAQAGVIWGAGRKSAVILAPTTDRKFWAAAGLLGRLELALAQTISLDGQVEAEVALARPRFSFSTPDIPMRRTPWLGISAGVGAALWFE